MLLGMLLSLEGSQLPAFIFSNFFCCFLRNLLEHASISAVFAGSLTELKEGCFIGRDISCARALWLWDIQVKRHCLLVALCDRVTDFPHWVLLDKAALRTGMVVAILWQCKSPGSSFGVTQTRKETWWEVRDPWRAILKGQTACRC